MQQRDVNAWASGFCDICRLGCGRCMLACFCPCVVRPDILARSDWYLAGRGDDGGAYCGLEFIQLLTGVPITCCFTAFARRRARESQKIPGDACSDCAAALCCTPCVLVQMDATARAAELRPMHAPDAVSMGGAPPAGYRPAGGAQMRARFS